MAEVDVFVRALLGAVFAVAVAGKLAARRELAASLTTFGLPASPVLAVAVIAAEVAVLVLLAATPVAGCVASGVVLLGFAVGLARVVRSGVRATCRCFGKRSAPITRGHVVRNGLLVGASATGALAGMHVGHVELATVVAAGLVGAAVGFVFTRWDDLAAVLRAPARARER